MTDNKSPGDRFLELAVFAPTGLAMTLFEEFPKLVEKGRHRVEGQVHTARLVGQFAVQMGRRQLEQSLSRLASDEGRHPDGAVADRSIDDGPGGARDSGPDGGAAEDPSEPGATPWRPSVWLGGGGPNGTASPSSLAIPGYDSLSASQVVQRLEGLSPAELEEVRAHEASHRQRRTILHRVEQLLTGGDSVPS